ARLERKTQRQIADANARALKIAEYGDRLSQLFGDLANRPDALGVIGVCTVREVQAGDIHARLRDRTDRVVRRGRWPEGTDYFRTANMRHQTLLECSCATLAFMPALRVSNDFSKLAMPSCRSVSVTSVRLRPA